VPYKSRVGAPQQPLPALVYIASRKLNLVLGGRAHAAPPRSSLEASEMPVYASYRAAKTLETTSGSGILRDASKQPLQKRSEREHFCTLGRTRRVDTSELIATPALLPQIAQLDISVPQSVLSPSAVGLDYTYAYAGELRDIPGNEFSQWHWILRTGLYKGDCACSLGRLPG
jgi:hypothetical protein